MAKLDQYSTRQSQSGWVKLSRTSFATLQHGWRWFALSQPFLDGQSRKYQPSIDTPVDGEFVNPSPFINCLQRLRFLHSFQFKRTAGPATCKLGSEPFVQLQSGVTIKHHSERHIIWSNYPHSSIFDRWICVAEHQHCG